MANKGTGLILKCTVCGEGFEQTIQAKSDFKNGRRDNPGSTCSKKCSVEKLRTLGSSFRERKEKCSRGHLRSPENVNNKGDCVLCHRIRSKEYSLNNKEHCRQKQRDYYLANKDHHKEYANRWRRDNWQRLRPLYKQRAKKPEYKERERKGAKKKIEELTDSYVSNCSRVKLSEVPQWFIEIKRLTIQLQRSLKNVKQQRNN